MENTSRIRGLFAFATFCFAAVMGANIYQMVAEVPNWTSDIPQSLVAYRNSIPVSHAGYFFQAAVPLTILSLLLSIILLWNRSREIRKAILFSFGGVLLSEIFTLVYFLPRNIMLFIDPIDNTSAAALKTAASQWVNANFIRMAMILVTMFFFLRAYALLSWSLQKAARSENPTPEATGTKGQLTAEA